MSHQALDDGQDRPVPENVEVIQHQHVWCLRLVQQRNQTSHEVVKIDRRHVRQIRCRPCPAADGRHQVRHNAAGVVVRIVQ